MTINRFIPTGIRNNKIHLSLGNAEELAKYVQVEFATSKRASVSKARIGRVLCAMAARRLQTTANSEFARNFDSVAISCHGIVPSVMNDLISGIIPGGVTNIIGESVEVTLLTSDYDELLAYVRSSLFIRDLESFKAFAQAQGVAFVAINCFTPFIQPSATARAAVDESEMDSKITLPNSLRIQTKVVEVFPGDITPRANFGTDPNVEEAAAGRISDDQLLTPFPDIIEDNKTFATVPAHPEAPLFSDFNSQAYHLAGADDKVATTAMAGGIMFPMFISSDSPKASDWLDLLVTSRISVTFEDLRDLALLIRAAFTKRCRDIATQGSYENPHLQGNMDTRTGVRGTPALGADPGRNNTPGAQPQIDDRPMMEDQGRNFQYGRNNNQSGQNRNDNRNRSDQGLNRPGQRGGNQQRNNVRGNQNNQR